MLTKIKKFIEKNQLIKRNAHLLAACSGGPDSLALVHVLYTLMPYYGHKLSVTHVNHMFRGAEADADAAFVGRFCEQLGLPFYHTAIDVPDYIKKSGLSPQDAARVLRYRYLRRLAALTGAEVATGHHQDDQAETVLLNLLRGAGSAGLSGMRARENGVIRPFLEIARQEIEEYCRQQGLNPRLDKSNLKTDYQRNFLRLELMPVLQKKFNANLTQTICRTAEIVSDELDYIRSEAQYHFDSLVAAERNSVKINCRKLNALHISLRREIFRMAIKKKRFNLKGITFFHVEKLIELALMGRVGSVIELPGTLIACKNYDSVELKVPAPVSPPSVIYPPGIKIAVPGNTAAEPLGIEISASLTDTRPVNMGAASVIMDWEKLSPPLFVRTRVEGDRFRPAGAGGSKKLKKFFIDEKVPREKRDAIPLFCDNQGILWITGFRIAERAAAGPDTKLFLQLIINAGGFISDQ